MLFTAAKVVGYQLPQCLKSTFFSLPPPYSDSVFEIKKPRMCFFSVAIKLLTISLTSVDQSLHFPWAFLYSLPNY